MRAATAAAEPDDEPPGVCWRFHGLRVGAGSRNANCVVWVLPRMTAPAARRRATAVESFEGRVWANSRAPAVVGMPATSKMSLIPIGTPCSGPRTPPARAPAAPGRDERSGGWGGHIGAPQLSGCGHVGVPRPQA